MFSKENKEKIINWFKEPKNLMLVGILLFALAIRLSYFFLTKSQPLWWDEAEYMLKAKNIAFGTPDTGWWFGRPILFSVISALFFKLGLNELGIRFFWVILSIINVYLVYYIGKSLFNKNIGLIASLIMAVSYIDLFYTFRLLVNLPEITFVLLAFSLFINVEFLNKSKKNIWWIIPIILIGVLIRFTVGLSLIILLIYLLWTKRLTLFKEKEWYISLGIGIILFVPYVIYSWIKTNNPLYFLTSVLVGSSGGRAIGDTPFHVFMQYIKYLPNYTNLLLFIFFLVAVISLLVYILLGFDKIGDSKKSKTSLFILLTILVPLIYFGFFVNHFEDRYLSMALPFIFILVAQGLDIVKELITKYLSKTLATLVILALLIFGIYSMYVHSEAIVKDKINSYNDLKKAGLWIKENTNPNESVMSSAITEITYYSERKTFGHLQNLTAEIEKIKETNATYFVISNWEGDPEWVYPYLSSNQTQFVPVYQSVSQYNSNKMFAVVFKINSEEL
jgi:4-amino-4-deoxy-L-arabinose transferase-like glycosyltransferase